MSGSGESGGTLARAGVFLAGSLLGAALAGASVYSSTYARRASAVSGDVPGDGHPPAADGDSDRRDEHRRRHLSEAHASPSPRRHRRDPPDGGDGGDGVGRAGRRRGGHGLVNGKSTHAHHRSGSSSLSRGGSARLEHDAGSDAAEQSHDPADTSEEEAESLVDDFEDIDRKLRARRKKHRRCCFFPRARRVASRVASRVAGEPPASRLHRERRPQSRSQRPHAGRATEETQELALAAEHRPERFAAEHAGGARDARRVGVVAAVAGAR